MTKQHPITLLPELVRQWIDDDDFPFTTGTFGLVSITKDRLHSVATQAARWGADQELEACCILLNGASIVPPDGAKTYPENQLAARERVAKLRAARRPKPPSLAEQALEALGPVPLPETGGTDDCFLNAGAIYRHDTIRAALERLQELEKGNE